jgi:Ala-tRNA(Pro) deacylase
MDVLGYLTKFEAEFTVEERRPVWSAGQAAGRRRFGGVSVARAAVIRAGDKRYMCVLPADCAIDLMAIQEEVGAVSAGHLDDAEKRDMFPGCENGAEPPFGALYGLPTLMDASMEQDEYIAFRGEKYDRSIVMSMAEYRRLASPRVFSFARPALETSASRL